MEKQTYKVFNAVRYFHRYTPVYQAHYIHFGTGGFVIDSYGNAYRIHSVLRFNNNNKEKETTEFRVICTGYYPDDEMIEFYIKVKNPDSERTDALRHLLNNIDRNDMTHKMIREYNERKDKDFEFTGKNVLDVFDITHSGYFTKDGRGYKLDDSDFEFCVEEKDEESANKTE